jgi:hypothetical protein
VKRIRYFKQADGSRKSKPIITMDDVVTIEVKGLTFNVVGSNGEIRLTGESHNETTLKKMIKDYLKSKGAEFFDEVRNRKGNE